MELSEKALQVVNRLDTMSMSDELEILKHLTEKYGLKTISDYSISSGQNRQTIYNKINRGDIPSIDLMGITFIIEI